MSVLDGLLKPPRFDHKDKKHDDKDDGPDREKYGKDDRGYDKDDKEHKADWKGDWGRDKDDKEHKGDWKGDCHDKDDKEHKADWKGDKDGPWQEEGKFCWKDDWKDDDHGKKWHTNNDDDCGCDGNGGNTEIGELHAALVQLSDVIDVVNVAIGQLDSGQSYDHVDSFDSDAMPA